MTAAQREAVANEAPTSEFTATANAHAEAIRADLHAVPDGPLKTLYVKRILAYPRLVETLRYYALPGMGDNGDKARVLLRDLGELAPVKPQTEAGDK